jgi:hypothetical protein
MPGEHFHVIPRITELQTGIYSVRKHMKGAWIDKENCALGVQRLTGYRKKWNTAKSVFIDEPDKYNGCSEGADAFRQWAQAKDLGLIAEAALPTSDFSKSRKPANVHGYEPPAEVDWRIA